MQMQNKLSIIIGYFCKYFFFPMTRIFILLRALSKYYGRLFLTLTGDLYIEILRYINCHWTIPSDCMAGLEITAYILRII